LKTVAINLSHMSDFVSHGRDLADSGQESLLGILPIAEASPCRLLDV
jgi:hypothetical protein